MNTISFNFTIFDNIFLDKDYLEAIIKNTPQGHYTERDIYGRWVRAEGVIYTNWEQEDFEIEFLKSRFNMIHICSLDFGWEDPTAFLDLYVDEKNKKIYINDEIYKSHMHNEELVSRIKQLNLDRIEIIADSANPKDIENLYNMGLSYIRAIKKREIVLGIRNIMSYTMVVHPRCENTIRELNNYSWSESKSDKPIDRFNHSLNNVKHQTSGEYKLGKKSGTLKCQSDLKLVA